jgi:hypothetical protein
MYTPVISEKDVELIWYYMAGLLTETIFGAAMLSATQGGAQNKAQAQQGRVQDSDKFQPATATKRFTRVYK